MPQVLCCSGLDPTGGAGIQADIEAIAAQGARALSLITALTVQDSRNVVSSRAVEAGLLRQQLDVLRADCAFDAIKIGLIGDAAQLPLLAELIADCGKPVVIDPVLRAGGGHELVGLSMAAAMREALFAHCTVLTPNTAEARLLSGEQSLEAAASFLLASGVQHLLITGGDEAGELVRDYWYRPSGVKVFERQRIAGQFHGAGCTLAATIAARLALAEPIEQALQNALHYVAETLRQGQAVGRGRWLPRRVLRPAERG